MQFKLLETVVLDTEMPSHVLKKVMNNNNG